MPIPMFRAVPRDRWIPGERLGRLNSRRTPSNVPYLVDNLWEFLRPDDAPSRRHAVYASPTPALALAHATGQGQGREAFVVTQVQVHGEVKQVQLSCRDARYHPDVSALPRAVISAMGAGWADRPVAEKSFASVLYTPGVTRAEMGAAARHCYATLRALECAEQCSTLWADSRSSASVDGEFFFELVDDAWFTLVALDSTAKILDGDSHDR